ncbi:MAG: hypothetical protein ABSC06_12405 [Rhodopila sp.]|jgi:F0F1-type ATP synthase membrane subunit c/vacuolar-type H+-ATPase subunit K
MRRLALNLIWACAIVAVAAYGSVVVRNITETLVGITSHQSAMVVVQRPNR